MLSEGSVAESVQRAVQWLCPPGVGHSSYSSKLCFHHLFAPPHVVYGARLADEVLGTLADLTRNDPVVGVSVRL